MCLGSAKSKCWQVSPIALLILVSMHINVLGILRGAGMALACQSQLFLLRPIGWRTAEAVAGSIARVVMRGARIGLCYKMHP
jgi:hypothetical protein